MKYILICAMLFGIAKAQTPTLQQPSTAGGWTNINPAAYGSIQQGLIAWKTLGLPTGNGAPSGTQKYDVKVGLLYMDSTSGDIYKYNPKTTAWSMVSGGGSGATYTLTRNTDSVILTGSNGDRYAVKVTADAFQNLVFGATLGSGSYNGSAPLGPVDADTVNYIATKSDLTNGVVININDTAPKWGADTILRGDFTGIEGKVYLIWNHVTGTTYVGHEQQIMTVTGGINNYQDATIGDQIYILKDKKQPTTYRLYDTGWTKVSTNLLAGGQKPTAKLSGGTLNKQPFVLIQNNNDIIKLDSGHIYEPEFVGADSSSVYSTWDANGKKVAGHFRPLVAGTNITINGDTINAAWGGSSSGLQHVVAGNGLANVNDSTLKADTSLLKTTAAFNRDSAVINAEIVQLRNGKQDNITLTTTGTSGAATLVGATLNIPQYSGGGGGSSSVFDSLTWINAKWYGAIADSTTDNTTAFGNAIAALIARGGGTLYIPNGFYVGKIEIPYTGITNKLIPIRIIGASPPAQTFGTTYVMLLNSNGVTIRTPDTTGAVIKVNSFGATFNFVTLYLENLQLRSATTNPKTDGIDALWCQQLDVNNCFINSNIYGVQAVLPTHNTSGIITPNQDNDAVTNIRNTAISGYRNGIIVHEHTSLTDINIAECYNALNIARSAHSINGTRVGLQMNHYNIFDSSANNPVYLAIQNMDIEHDDSTFLSDSTKWQQTEADVYDPTNLLNGIVFYHLTRPPGILPFTKNGGTGLNTYALDSTSFAVTNKVNNVFNGGGNSTRLTMQGASAGITLASAAGTDLWSVANDPSGAGNKSFGVYNIKLSATPLGADSLGNALIGGVANSTTNAGLFINTSKNATFNGNVGFGTAPTSNRVEILGDAKISNSATGALYIANNAGTLGYFKQFSSAFGITSLQNKTAFASDGSIDIFAGGANANSSSTTINFKPDGYDAIRATMSQNYFVIKNRLQTSKGANVASANNLTLGVDGNVFHVTGTTTINAITTANWAAGSEFTLIFDGSLTVKNNTAGGGGTAVMLLAGGVDFSATANDVLKLVWDGTSFFEISRSVN